MLQLCISDEIHAACPAYVAAVVEAGNEIKQWTLKERQEIDRILGEFTDRVAPDADLYRHNIEVLAEGVERFLPRYLEGGEKKP